MQRARIGVVSGHLVSRYSISVRKGEWKEGSMGIANKISTNIRTKEQQTQIAFRGSWTHGIERLIAESMRAAVLSLSSHPLRSSSFRGRGGYLSRSVNSAPSSVWYEKVDEGIWQISLGCALGNFGKALDWCLQFEVGTAPEGYFLSTTTPVVLTIDGSQVHKDEYRETRDLVQNGLMQGQTANPSVELEASKVSLLSYPNNLKPPSKSEMHFSDKMKTSLPQGEVLMRLERLPYLCLRREGATFVHHVGPQLGDNLHVVHTEVIDNGGERCITVAYDLTPTSNIARDASSLGHAKSLVGSIERLLFGSQNLGMR
jgi:hypothetical protein